MRILLTNDDGIEAEGMRTLAAELSQEHEVLVIAPKHHRSCCGHAVTTDHLLEFGFEKSGWYWVDGYPADCVRVGLSYLKFSADWIISGVNHGGNLGIDFWMSGTVAGAREAVLYGHRSIAFSQYRHPQIRVPWTTSARRAVAVFKELQTQQLNPGEFWNVNLPAVDINQPTPEIAWCEPETQPLSYSLELKGESLMYHSNYQARPHTAESDVGQCFAGKITICRLTTRGISIPPANFLRNT